MYFGVLTSFNVCVVCNGVAQNMFSPEQGCCQEQRGTPAGEQSLCSVEEHNSILVCC